MTIAKRLLSVPWLAYVVAAAGGVFYVLHAATIAHTKTSYLDEGLYLYKGYLFASGVYQPYQDYGPWTNHMPLVFLIHGYIQKWFGPGLAAGRYFMIFLGTLTCLGLWVLARRWGGRWWAAGAVWVMALNPAEIKIHTLAISEGLIAPMLVWMLVLTLGMGRSSWQVWLGSALAAVMWMTRLNLAFVLPILLVYVLWQHGWKTALQATLSAFFVVAAVHAVFWPNILKYWVDWLPAWLTPFLSSWRVSSSAVGEPVPIAEPANFFRIFLYIWLTLRLHFVAILSALTVWLCWPRRKRPLTGRIRAVIFVSVLLVVLMAAHMYAAFKGGYCVSCILLYVGNFDFLGLVLLIAAYRLLARELPVWRRVLILAAEALVILGVGFSAYEDVDGQFATSIMDRIRDFYPWNVLQNVTGLPPLMLFRQTFVSLISLLVVAVLTVFLVIRWRLALDRGAWARRIGLTALNLLLILGLIFSPTKALGRGNDFFDCGSSDVLDSYQQAGDYLRSIIPPGAKVYWEGRLAAIFLYLPGVVVYPPQLNHVHSFYYGGDAETLYRLGRWNDVLARKWITEADYILLQKGFVQEWEQRVVESQGYIKLESTRKLEKCQWQSVIDVYQRVK